MREDRRNVTVNCLPEGMMFQTSLCRLFLFIMIIFVVMAFTHPSRAVMLRVENVSGSPGEELALAVLIDDEGDTLSAEFTLGYDRTILTATGAETSGLTSDCMIAHSIKGGRISVALGGDVAIKAGKDAVVKVKFNISEHASAGRTAVTIFDAAVYGSDYQYRKVNGFNGTVTILRTNGSGENPLCPVTALYGEHSKETALLRNVRDTVLTQTPEGRECIKLYYAWSPVIAQAMADDEALKADVKKLIDGVLEKRGGTLLNK